MREQHGDSFGGVRTKEYSAWHSMIGRCHRPGTGGYKHYGGRGISVCAAWRHSYLTFLGDMGLAPSATHSVDRIDPNGNYEPSNCRWADRDTQNNNKRRHFWLTINGETKTLSQWSRASGVNLFTIRLRALRGVAGPALLAQPASANAQKRAAKEKANG